MSYQSLLAAAALFLAAPPLSAAAAPGGVHVIVNVDIIPDDHIAGARTLAAYAGEARKDYDLQSIALIQQAGSTNHFILDETFADKAAYARHVGAAYVRRFRATLYPLLGSPWDERSGTDITP